MWTACAALFALSTMALGYGVALLTSGLRIPSWVASLLGLVLVAWAFADGVNVFEGSPTVALGHIALWPLEFNVLGLVAIAVSAGALLWGLALIGNVSVEAAERRSTLVGQLRFAATLQDIRTVLVLRRQLAMELPRLRPWIRTRAKGIRRFPVWTRGVQGLLRWPAARVARLVLLGAVAGLAARGAWSGTSPLIIVAGLALYIAALDAVESLSQEVDHPTRRDSMPVEAGAVELRHLPVAVVSMLGVCVVAFIAGVVVGPSFEAVEIAAACLVPAALGAVAGATVSVLAGPASATGGDSWSLMPPEVAGMRLVFRNGWPPAMAIIGIVPILAARTAARNGASAPAVALAAGAAVLLLFVIVCGWVRQRAQIHAWWRRQMDAAMPSSREPEVAES